MRTKITYLKSPYLAKFGEVQLSNMKDNQVLIEVMACAVCGGDISGAKTNEEFKPFGHEISGIVRQVGAHVDSKSV